MKIINPITDKIASIASTIEWTILIALVATGVSAATIAAIIFLYVFAAIAHLSSAIGYARAFLWRG